MFRHLYLLLAIFTLSACEASFEDLRSEPLNRAGETDPLVDPLATSPDAGAATGDSGYAGPEDLETVMNTGDAENEPNRETVIATGEVQARANYGGEGNISLVQLSDGSYELRFEDDFQVGGVPGPVVVLSLEATLGSSLESERGDVELGVLETDRGASSYVLPFAPGQRRYAWVYCKPFGLEVVRAELIDVN